MLNEHLELQVKQKLVADPHLSSQPIEVVADDGSITLEGEVQSYRRKLAAHQIAMSDDAVVEVNNRLTVKPCASNNDAAIAGNVNEFLNRAEVISNESIRVEVRDGIVSLTGYVGTEAEMLRVLDIAAVVDGVVAVNNYLMVNPDQVAANREHSDKILHSLGHIIGMENENIRLAVVNETASLSGSVDSPWKKEVAEKVVRQFGILNVSNEIAIKR